MAGVSETHELARTRANAPSTSRTGPAANSREFARTVQTGSRVAALSLALRASQEEVERLRGMLQDVESLKSVKPVCRYV
jgi:Flp pilus assembly protein CpaB